jgi:hypothetical protein
LLQYVQHIKIPDEYLKLTIQGLRNNLEYVSVMAKGVDSFNENEEQQDKIKRTLQYPKAGRGHVNLSLGSLT